MASAATIHEPQSAPAVLMVRPARFGFNAQTAASNAFQHGIAAAPGAAGDNEVRNLALREFDALAEALARAGVGVIVADDTAEPVKPDAVFPNNWVSFHLDGTVVLYPMMAPNRRGERREEVLRRVRAGGGFRIARTVDLTHHEQQGKFLEGTGSMVLDRVNRVAYANLSPRTHLDVLGDFAQRLDYELVTFDACDGEGRAIYHANVLLAIGSGFAAVCGAAIGEPRHREAVYSKLRASGHELIELLPAQMRAFAGNLLELAPAGAAGPERRIALSGTAWRSLDPAQRRTLERHGGIVCVEIPTIERYGGGGVRCMLAEIHLPSRAGRMESASTLLS